MSPNPGEIYWTEMGGGAPRPVLVVSRQDLNHGDDVVVVPFTTQHLDERRESPSCVFFSAGDAGLEKDCVAQTDAIARIRVLHLGGKLSADAIDPVTFRDIIKAIGHVIDSDCEPV